MEKRPTDMVTNQPVPTHQKPTIGAQKHSRTNTIWVASVLFLLIMILLMIFLLQNSQTVKVSYLGFNGNISLAVAMLCSAIIGAGLLALAGGARILQLRRTKAK
jgi:uncharacterized integral membrane protein